MADPCLGFILTGNWIECGAIEAITYIVILCEIYFTLYIDKECAMCLLTVWRTE